MASYLNNITCSNDFLLEVLTSLGYPMVSKDTINDIFDDTFIKETIIGKSAEIYFQYFPIVQNVAITVSPSSEVSVDAPENTLGIIHYSFVVGNNNNVNLNSGNPFYTASITNNSSGNRNTYGTPFDFNSYHYSSYQNAFYNRSMLNLGKSYMAWYNESENKIYAKSSEGGTISVNVGCYETDVDLFPRLLRGRFLELCQCQLQMKFAQIIKLQNSDLPLEIDASSLYDDGNEIYEKWIEWAEQNSSMAIMR